MDAVPRLSKGEKVEQGYYRPTHDLHSVKCGPLGSVGNPPTTHEHPFTAGASGQRRIYNGYLNEGFKLAGPT